MDSRIRQGYKRYEVSSQSQETVIVVVLYVWKCSKSVPPETKTSVSYFTLFQKGISDSQYKPQYPTGLNYDLWFWTLSFGNFVLNKNTNNVHQGRFNTPSIHFHHDQLTGNVTFEQFLTLEYKRTQVLQNVSLPGIYNRLVYLFTGLFGILNPENCRV